MGGGEVARAPGGRRAGGAGPHVAALRRKVRCPLSLSLLTRPLPPPPAPWRCRRPPLPSPLRRGGLSKRRQLWAGLTRPAAAGARLEGALRVCGARWGGASGR